MINKISIILLGMLSVCFTAGAQPFHCVVAADGSGDFATVQSAVDACPDTERSFIFVKNGTYYGQTSIGSKSVASLKIITLIGENQDSVILTYDKSLNSAGVTTFEQATTFQIYAKNFYAENVTFANSAGNTGQALALYTAGDMSIFKNCKLTGYQDTYRSKKGTRGYFYKCWIEGAVDFIYAGGTLFFDDCTINCISGGGYITAPEDAYATIPSVQTTVGKFLRLGFIFRNCNITANADVADNTYTLGRPWNTYCGSMYINCKLGKHIKAAGWTAWGGNETTACFAEYKSVDENGGLIDTSGRVSWSFQLPQADVDNLLTPAGVYARNYTTTFDPVTTLIQTDAPQNLSTSGLDITWDNVNNAVGYIIYGDNRFIGFTTTNSFTLSSVYTVVKVFALNQTGVLSPSSQIFTATPIVKNTINYGIANKIITFGKVVDAQLFSVNGKLIKQVRQTSKLVLSEVLPGTYLIFAKTTNGDLLKTKIVVN